VPVSVILAIGCVVGWVGAALWTRWRPSRTLPLDYASPVPEPVLMVLWPRARRDGPAILNAVVLELAEAGVLHIEPADSQGPAMVSPRTLPHASQLIGYQASVVSRLLHRQGVSRMPVPLTALQPDEDPTASKWYGDFFRQVQHAAADRGLLQRAIGSTRFVSMLLSSWLVSVLASNALAHYWHGPAGQAMIQFVLFAVVMFGVLAWASQIRPTRAGQAVTAALIQETPMAPANPVAATARPDATLVMPPVPEFADSAPDVRVLPNQLQPLPKNQVWSAYGGSWHPLNINTAENYAVRNGGPVILIPVFFAIVSLVGAFVSKRGGDPTGTVSFAFFSALPLVVLVFLVAGMLRRRHLPKRAVIRGQVAKLWEVKHSSGDGDTREYYCSLDVGRGPESVRLKVGRDLFRRLQVGVEVEVLVNPRRKSLKDIRFLGPEGA